MSEHSTGPIKGLPENAYKELKPGEEYSPIMSPQKTYPEISAYSVIWGLVMAVLFSAAAAYLGLKIGQVFEAAIPIAIIAVGLSTLTKRKSALGENVIIQSIGQNSGLIVAGAIFTIPALYILNLDAHFYQIFLASLFGGILGILFLIPFRKYYSGYLKGLHKAKYVRQELMKFEEYKPVEELLLSYLDELSHYSELNPDENKSLEN